MRNILIVAGAIIGLVLLVVGLLIYYYYPKAEKIIEFIGKHPDKAAIVRSRNGSTLVARNTDKVMPSSTVKIIIAIEYALQSASGRFDPEEPVDTAALDLFYVADTDGGAYPEWPSSVSDRIENGRIGIREIAKDMI